MTQQDRYEFCQELLSGFVESLSPIKIRELHAASTVIPTPTLAAFTKKDLPFLVVLELLDSEYGYMFSDLSDAHYAALLGISTKELAYLNYVSSRKLKLSKIGNKTIDDTKELLEELYYTDDSNSSDTTDEISDDC